MRRAARYALRASRARSSRLRRGPTEAGPSSEDDPVCTDRRGHHMHGSPQRAGSRWDLSPSYCQGAHAARGALRLAALGRRLAPRAKPCSLALSRV